MVSKLTKRIVDAVPTPAKDVVLWDSELKGFGLKVTPKGRRVFLAQYWAPNLYRVKRRVTLGLFGTLTVDQARQAAERLLGKVANGEDPALGLTENRRMSKEETVTIVSVLYLAEMQAKMKPRSFEEYDRAFRIHIRPALGRIPVNILSSREVAALHLSLKDTPYQANRTIQYLRAFLNWCEARNYRKPGPNPCARLERFDEQPRERFLTVEEVGRLGAALVQALNEGLPPAPVHRKKPKSERTAKHRPKLADAPIKANPYAVAAIRFLMLTGWREQEALTLGWADVDTERGIATLPRSKTGRSHRPLGTPALDLLAALPRIEGSLWVFPGANPSKPLREIQRTWYAVRYAAGLNDVRLHDLRHTVASFAVGAGHSLYLTGKLLGHTRAETTQRYAHLGDDARKATADSVSSAIAAAMSGRSA